VAGPIERATNLLPQFQRQRQFDYGMAVDGCRQMLWGFFKKLVIADNCAVVVNEYWNDYAQLPGTALILLAVLFTIQIYCDFSGYSDIAIGCARLFGFNLMRNFDNPYFSRSMPEFWRRWHISLISWFRDYIFYPISVCGWMLKLTNWSRKHLGNFIGKQVPVYLAMAVTWFATGIWHGAAWNFIVWGMLNCLVLIISQELNPFYEWFHSKVNVQGKLGWKLFQVVRTFVLMSSIRILDCYRDVPLTFHQVGTIFTTANLGEVFTGLTGLGMGWADWVIVVLGTLLMLAVSLIQRKGSVREQLDSRPAAVQAAVFAVLIYVVLIFGAYGIGFDANQFIYNQF
jgi:D-alanyl-lipoteichoic acid acyltransferase DltB (MBOAT superfamily)